jgi:ferredoxin-fold anticodon binding domain-containing protein
MNIKKYEVISLDGKGLLSGKNGFTISEVEVIAENDIRMVLRDQMFTRLEKKKSYCFESIDAPSIGVYTGDNCWGSGVRYTLYTFKKKKADTIKKEIVAVIQKKCGYFMREIDLTMLVDSRPDKGEA